MDEYKNQKTPTRLGNIYYILNLPFAQKIPFKNIKTRP